MALGQIGSRWEPRKPRVPRSRHRRSRRGGRSGRRQNHGSTLHLRPQVEAPGLAHSESCREPGLARRAQGRFGYRRWHLCCEGTASLRSDVHRIAPIPPARPRRCGCDRVISPATNCARLLLPDGWPLTYAPVILPSASRRGGPDPHRGSVAVRRSAVSVAGSLRQPLKLPAPLAETTNRLAP